MKRNVTCDLLNRVECDRISIKRTKLIAGTSPATITLPSVDGTLALISNIGPTNYVDLVSNQTISGVKSFLNTLAASGGSKIGVVGSTTYNEVRGTVFYFTPLAAGSFITLSAVNYTGNIGFGGVPSMICSLQLISGSTFWDQCQVVVTSNSSTQVSFSLKNNTSSTTTGTVGINYIAWY